MKVHYTNMEKVENVKDASGLRLYFTKSLRKFDIGLMILGTNDLPLAIQIPGQTKSISVTTTCYSECSQVKNNDTCRWDEF